MAELCLRVAAALLADALKRKGQGEPKFLGDQRCSVGSVIGHMDGRPDVRYG